MDLPDPGIELGSPALQVDSLPPELSGEKRLVGPLGTKPVSPAVEAQILTTGPPSSSYHTSTLFKPPLPLGKRLGASLVFRRPPSPFHLVYKESSGGGRGGVFALEPPWWKWGHDWALCSSLQGSSVCCPGAAEQEQGCWWCGVTLRSCPVGAQLGCRAVMNLTSVSMAVGTAR